MNESISIEIQFKSSLAEISSAELALLELIFPELLEAVQAENDSRESTHESVE